MLYLNFCISLHEVLLAGGFQKIFVGWNEEMIELMTYVIESRLTSFSTSFLMGWS